MRPATPLSVNATPSLCVDRAGSSLVGGGQPTNSPRAPSLARSGLTDLPTGLVSPNHTLGAPQHCSVGAEFGDQPSDNVAKRGRLVFIGIGEVALPFKFFAFHSAASSQTRSEDNAR